MYFSYAKHTFAKINNSVSIKFLHQHSGRQQHLFFLHLLFVFHNFIFIVYFLIKIVNYLSLTKIIT